MTDLETDQKTRRFDLVNKRDSSLYSSLISPEKLSQKNVIF